MASSEPHSALLPITEPGIDNTPPLNSIPSPGVLIPNCCEPCRKRSTRCDKARPSCNMCALIYNTDCEYIENDGDRNAGIRREISQSRAEDKETILEVLKKGSEADVDDVIQLIRDEKSYKLIADSIRKNCLDSLKQSDMPGLEVELDAPDELDESLQVNQNNVGEPRHYGHTANLTTPETPTEFFSISDEFTPWTTVTDDSFFLMHLLDLYFAWTHPFYVLFPQDVFWHGFSTRKVKYCNPALLNAILSVACNFSDRMEARANACDPTTVGSHFFAEAKRFFEQNPRSCVANVQALGVMSLRQAMNNHDSSGWDYRGRMMNMSVDLGLHLKYTGPTNGNVTETEVEVRRITFWGCYVLEIAWAIRMGRISSLPNAAIRLPKPSTAEDLKKTMWEPYSDEDSRGQFPRLTQPGVTYTLLYHLCRLSEIVNDTIHMFYAPRERITSRKLQRYHNRFQQWYNNLPGVLTLKQYTPTLPQVLTLHIYYHNCINHLFRPYMRVVFKEGTKSPRQICLEEAVAISQLMKTYQATYGLRRGFLINTHCITSAAMIHLFHMSDVEPSPVVAAEAAKYLLEEVLMLRQMLALFPIVERHLKMLRRLVSNWRVNLPDNIRNVLRASYLPPIFLLDAMTPAARDEGTAALDVGMTPAALGLGISPAALDVGVNPAALDLRITPASLDMGNTPAALGMGIIPAALDEVMTSTALGMGNTPATPYVGNTPAAPYVGNVDFDSFLNFK